MIRHGGYPLVLVLLCLLLPAGIAWSQQVERSRPRGAVTVLAMSDALDAALLDEFRRETGMAVLVDSYTAADTVPVLLAKPGYDVALFPVASLRGAVRAKVLAPLDAASAEDGPRIDPILTKAVANFDADGTHALPFDWYPTGFAINAAKLAAVGLAIDEANAGDVFRKPETLRLAAGCGLGVPDRPRLLFTWALSAFGSAMRNTNLLDRRRAFAILTQLRVAAKKNTEAELIAGLAQGNLCLALVPAPDAQLAAARAREAGNGVAVSFALPAEGAPLSVDVLALPSNAVNRDGGLAFIRFLMQPDHSGQAARYGLVAPAVETNGPSGARDLSKLFIPPENDPALDRAIDSEWRRGAGH